MVYLHVHLTDNFGYHDEHLAIGEGNAPIEDIIKILKKHGVNDFLVETTGTTAEWLKSIESIGAPLYITQSGPFHWEDVNMSFYGMRQKPYFILHSYVPIMDTQPWLRDVPFE